MRAEFFRKTAVFQKFGINCQNIINILYSCIKPFLVKDSLACDSNLRELFHIPSALNSAKDAKESLLNLDQSTAQ